MTCKKIVLALFIISALASCKKDEVAVPEPVKTVNPVYEPPKDI